MPCCTVYMDTNIWPAGRNSAGMHYAATCNGKRFLAETVRGMKAMIRAELEAAA